MSGESPITAITTVTAIFGYAIAQLVTEPINPGHPSFPMILALFGATLGTTWELVTKHSWKGAQMRAFMFSFFGASIGILVYVGCLISTFR
jgi:hypothetical protein